jgi:hypothetical protein
VFMYSFAYIRRITQIILQAGHINLFTVRHEPGRMCHVMNGHRGPVSALSMQHDEKGFFSAGWDGEALVSLSNSIVDNISFRLPTSSNGISIRGRSFDISPLMARSLRHLPSDPPMHHPPSHQIHYQPKTLLTQLQMKGTM